MGSKRIYITLNSNKEKDKIILDYLESTYSASETIKSILYQFATNKGNLMQIDTKIEVIKDSSKVQKGASNSKEVIINSTDKRINNKEIIVDNDIKNMFL